MHGADVVDEHIDVTVHVHGMLHESSRRRSL